MTPYGALAGAPAASTPTTEMSTKLSGPVPTSTAVSNDTTLTFLFFIFLNSGKACLYATKCQYWTFRYHQRKCYLLKSCCRHERKGFLSGDQHCPVYEGEEARSLNAEDYDEEEEPLNIEEDFDEESMNDEESD